MDQVHHIIDTLINTVAILSNCYLLYLIRYHSTFGVKLYQHLLTIDSALDLFLCVSAFVAQPVGFTGDGYTAVMLNGFFGGTSARFDSLTLTFYLFALHTSIIWIPVQFVYRYRLLCKTSSSLIQTNALIAVVTIAYSAIAFVVCMGFCEVRDEYQSIGVHVLQLNNWTSSRSGLFMGGHMTEWRMIYYVLLWTTTSCASIFVAVWCEKAIGKNFKALSHLSSGNAQKMHKEFQRALLAMAICPLFTTSIPVFYFMTTIGLRLCPGRISAVMAIFLSSISLFNPLTTIICFRCYRRATVRLITFGRLANSKYLVQRQEMSNALISHKKNTAANFKADPENSS
ncbi:serpentine type 7TM GPCR chemoreceptor srd domain-containing protein [Ditylenchus destructor]|uniref:Serpentine type 7TM GPCR chemoreceptor srd domain-containing protein n=1 Tax=Ditylenchus destructor TaxID=166010 RepID=A0AAD4QTT9_9BILA|nr:serpentine type 7TM GPCR chemoreceptor srd domain-containing protein [Ditylenchus destructor]